MEKWLDSGAAKLFDSGTKLASALPLQYPTAAPDVRVSTGGTKDVQFRQGTLGFTLENMHVVALEESRQAARNGVQVGDRLTKVDGREVPEYDPGDEEEEQRVNTIVTKWLQEMPLPAILTFVADSDGDTAARQPDATETSAAALQSEEDVGLNSSATPRRHSSELDVAAASVSPEVLFAALPNDMHTLKEQLVQEQRHRAQLSSELLEQQRKFSAIWKQFASVKAENKQILSVQCRAEAASTEALEEAAIKEEALREEIAQLRQSVSLDAEKAIKSSTAADTKLVELQAANDKLRKESQEATSKLAVAESQAQAAQHAQDSLQRQLGGYHAEHEGEIELLRKKYEKWEKEAVEKFAELKVKHKEETGALRSELEQLRKKTSAAAVEPSSLEEEGCVEEGGLLANPRGRPPRSRRFLVEHRAASASTYRNDSALHEAAQTPSWAPQVLGVMGSHVGAALVIVYSALNVASVRVTLILLNKARWRWIFFCTLGALVYHCHILVFTEDC